MTTPVFATFVTALAALFHGIARERRSQSGLLIGGGFLVCYGALLLAIGPDASVSERITASQTYVASAVVLLAIGLLLLGLRSRRPLVDSADRPETRSGNPAVARRFVEGLHLNGRWTAVVLDDRLDGRQRESRHSLRRTGS